MKFFDRWRVARCIDQQRELPSGLARRTARCPELSAFRSGLAEVERALRDAAPPRDFAPPGLAAGVMERLAASRRPVRTAWRPRLFAAPAFATAALCAVAAYVLGPLAPRATAPPPSPAPIWRATDWASDLGVGHAPVAEPLAREARLLARDTRRAAGVVLAAFPAARPSGH